MTLPETVENHYRSEEHADEDEALSDCDDIFGPSSRTILRRTKNKISMISNELRLREKRKRVLQLCLRKLERIKDSENNLRRSVCIHNTFSRLTADIKQEKRDKERGQNRNQQQQQQSYKELHQKCQKMPKKVEKFDLDNLEELCSIEDNVPWDPILKNSEEIEQAFLSRKRKAEVEKALLSYHQLEKRLKSDISNAYSFRDHEGHDLSNLNLHCSNNSINNNINNNNILNSFPSNMCGAAALDASSNGIFQSLVINRSLET